jgi:hypothetical protein
MTPQPHLRKMAALRLKKVNPVEQLAEKSAGKVMSMRVKLPKPPTLKMPRSGVTK